jgi:hypothetical protein
MSKFQDAMRRVLTGDSAQGQSVIIIDGGPSSEIGSPDLGGLFEIWDDAAVGALTPRAHEDLGTTRPVLGPRKGNFQVRWFVISPLPEGVPKPVLDATVRERLAAFDGAGHIIDQTRHPGMHETHSIDIICLLQGEASSFSKAVKRDCGQATWLFSVGPTTPGTHMVARPYSWPF